MLEATFQSDFTPGTNLRGHVVGASWSLLLPRLELERIVCLGPPSAASLRRLVQLGREVVVACRTQRQVSSTQSIAEAGARSVGGMRACRTVLLADYSLLDLPPVSADLVVLADRAALRRAATQPGFVQKLRQWLKPEGTIYCESAGWQGRSAFGRLRERLSAEGVPFASLWLTPLRGEVQTVVPSEDRPTVEFMLTRALMGRPVPAQPPQRRGKVVRILREAWLEGRRRCEALVNSSRRLRDRRGRHALLAGSSVRLLDGPPQYLRDLARRAGCRLDGCRWALAALGQFSSRKVLWFLFDESVGPAEGPTHLVKMTRTPAHNVRLERERDALLRLAQWGIGDRESLPRVAFSGRHGGLAILGETAVRGVAFDQRTDFSPACPYGRAALEWFTRLGERTADPAAADPDDMAERLEQLLERFAAVYQPAAEQRRFLANQLAAIARSRDPVPLVFQHGDPGRWNLLITNTGRVAVLDWESAETGLPLWDVLYLFRSIVSGAARHRGRVGRCARLRQLFLADVAFGDLLTKTVQNYCERIALASHLVEPLFHMCWMHRALKEATRLEPGRLPAGQYDNWLKLCIDQRDAPTLRRLFSLPSRVGAAERLEHVPG